MARNAITKWLLDNGAQCVREVKDRSNHDIKLSIWMLNGRTLIVQEWKDTIGWEVYGTLHHGLSVDKTLAAVAEYAGVPAVPA